MNWIDQLPTVNACLNSTSFVLLLLGYVQIRKRNINAHRAFMGSAFAVSCLFLVSYLTYHFYAGSTRFPDIYPWRTIYLVILLTHTVLAAVLAPMALITLSRGLSKRFDQHRRIARITLPIWLYVSLTGVLIYLMLYHWFAA
ncbi:MAG: DUF420 domain-containing protein [Armatimonadetes bacterium]|nr:DUF420 domain-containing protein [Armatimonadota bacterium]